MKKKTSIFLTIMLMYGSLFGCAGGSQKNGYIEHSLEPIAYENTMTVQQINENAIITSINKSIGKTGEAFVFSSRGAVGQVASGKVYNIVDWGDGTWSYQGVGEQSAAVSTAFSLSHKYKKAGSYAIKSIIKDTNSDGAMGWSSEKVVIVSGEEITENPITKFKPFSSSKQSDGTGADKMFDNKNDTAFVSAPCKKEDGQCVVDDEQFAGVYFDTIHSLKKIEVKFPKDEKFFPSNIAIEYTIDNGKTWQALNKYFYRYNYAKDINNPVMRFINPGGATLVFEMDDIVANGVRFSSKMFAMDKPREDKFLKISEMRIYGNEKPLLYSSLGGTYDAALNNMQTIYGTAKTEPLINSSLLGENPNKGYYRSGTCMIGSTEWQEWNGMKLNWTDYLEAQKINYNTLKCTVYGYDGWQTAVDGYIYATGEFSSSWLATPQHLGLQNHYTYNATFINACRNFILSGQDITALGETETTNFFEVKNRKNQTIMDRLVKAMNYNLEALNGKSGLITILDPRNDGTPKGEASNYWDAYKFMGYKSAYENILFYTSLGSMADIYEVLGNSERVSYFRNLQNTSKQKFNETYWDSEKGRYISSIDITGRVHDFGLTFVNFLATSAGLASSEQGKQIYDWVGGKRIIESDTSKGEDIYGKYKYAARSNTLDVSSTGEPYYFWTHNGLMNPAPGGGGAYGKNIQNGGAIFYTSYYDMIGRVNTIGADSANERLLKIIDEFAIDEVRRFNVSTTGAEGIIGEFPESGLVPQIFMNGYIGLSYSAKGLNVKPNLPSSLDYAGISRYFWQGNRYDIKVSKAVKEARIEKKGDVYFVELPSDGAFLISYDNAVAKLN